MSKYDRIDRGRLVELIKEYVRENHVGDLETYTFHNIKSFDWMDKANGEIKVSYKMKIEANYPTIGTPPINFESDTVVIADYKTVRPHSLNYSGFISNSYPDWMK